MDRGPLSAREHLNRDILAWLAVTCQPCGEFGGCEDAEGGGHAVMAEAADLGAEAGVGSGGYGSEVEIRGESDMLMG